MERQKLFSMRCEKTLLNKIDEYCAARPYLSRSAFINRVLNAVVTCSDAETLQNIVETYDPYSAGFHVRFLKIEQHL